MLLIAAQSDAGLRTQRDEEMFKLGIRTLIDNMILLKVETARDKEVAATLTEDDEVSIVKNQLSRKLGHMIMEEFKEQWRMEVTDTHFHHKLEVLCL